MLTRLPGKQFRSRTLIKTVTFHRLSYLRLNNQALLPTGTEVYQPGACTVTPAKRHTILLHERHSNPDPRLPKPPTTTRSLISLNDASFSRHLPSKVLPSSLEKWANLGSLPSHVILLREDSPPPRFPPDDVNEQNQPTASERLLPGKQLRPLPAHPIQRTVTPTNR